MQKKISSNIMNQLVQLKLSKTNPTNLLSYNRKLLLSSERNNAGLFVIDTEKNTFSKKHEGGFVGLVKYESGYMALKFPNKLCLFDFDLNIISELKISNRNEYNGLHGLALSDDGFIYIVDSTKNKVLIFNQMTMKKESELVLSNETSDLHHINDICVTKNSLYLSMFSVLGEWKNKGVEAWDGAIIRFDRKTLEPREIMIDNLTAPHSINIFDNHLYYCNSLKLNVSRIHLNSRRNETIAQFNGFTRGLYIDNNILIVGQSKMRHLQRLNKIFNNISIDAGIHLYDEEKNISRFILLPVENVYSIIAL